MRISPAWYISFAAFVFALPKIMTRVDNPDYYHPIRSLILDSAALSFFGSRLEDWAAGGGLFIGVSWLPKTNNDDDDFREKQANI